MLCLSTGFLYISSLKFFCADILNPFMKRTQKVILFILFVFTIRLVLSCCDCNNTVETFDLTEVEIYPIDNTGTYPQPSNDTLFREAIAFEIIIGSNQMQEFACGKSNFGSFNEAMACECEIYYKSNQTIDSITVFTNSELSFIYPDSTDLSDVFYASEINPEYSDNLYLTLNELVEEINNYQLANSMQYKFQVFLDKIYIDENIASFTFNFHLSNGEKLIGKSPEIILKTQN